MIKSFSHKGLEKLYREGSAKGVIPEHKGKLERILTVLDVAQDPSDIPKIGFRLHKLSGNLREHWSMTVSGNWRVTFRFDEGDVVVVNYVDYH